MLLEHHQKIQCLFSKHLTSGLKTCYHNIQEIIQTSILCQAVQGLKCSLNYVLTAELDFVSFNEDIDTLPLKYLGMRSQGKARAGCWHGCGSKLAVNLKQFWPPVYADWMLMCIAFCVLAQLFAHTHVYLSGQKVQIVAFSFTGRITFMEIKFFKIKQDWLCYLSGFVLMMALDLFLCDLDTLGLWGFRLTLGFLVSKHSFSYVILQLVFQDPAAYIYDTYMWIYSNNEQTFCIAVLWETTNSVTNCLTQNQALDKTLQRHWSVRPKIWCAENSSWL